MLCCRIATGAHAYWWRSTDVQCTHSLILDKIREHMRMAVLPILPHKHLWDGVLFYQVNQVNKVRMYIHTELYYARPHLILFVPPQYQHLCGLCVPGIQGKTIQTTITLQQVVCDTFFLYFVLRMNTCGVPSGSRSER